MNEWCSEADALSDIYVDEEVEFHCQEDRENERVERVSGMRVRYADNARSQVGTTIRCACCGKRILKKSYQTQFCRNKGAGNCKDKYWNSVVPGRAFTAKYFN